MSVWICRSGRIEITAPRKPKKHRLPVIEAECLVHEITERSNAPVTTCQCDKIERHGAPRTYPFGISAKKEFATEKYI